MASNNQRVSRPSPGDATGREKERLGKQAAEELKARGAETTMASAAQAYDEEHTVFDQHGQRIDDGAELIDVDDDLDEPQQGFGGGSFFDDDDEPVLTGHESDEELAPILAQRANPKPRRRHERAHSAEVIVRFDQDIDDMTYGMDPISMAPRNFSFKEGLKYKVSYDLAEHCDERGLVRQWVSN